MAEYFLDLNRERTMEGLKAALARGRKGGRPKKLTEADIAAGRAMLAAGDIPVAAIAKRLGVSRYTFYSYFPRARSAANAGGGELMPIRPEHRFFYPIDWPQLSVVIRFGRAKGRCEACKRPHGQIVYHLGDGRWWDGEARTWRDGQGRITRLASAAWTMCSHECAGPGSCWQPPIAITTPVTTRMPTWRPFVSAAT